MEGESSRLYAEVIGEIKDACFNFYVIQDSGMEFIAVSDSGRVGMPFGTVHDGFAYARACASPRLIGRVKYYPQPRQVMRAKPLYVEKEREPVREDPNRPKRIYER